MESTLALLVSVCFVVFLVQTFGEYFHSYALPDCEMHLLPFFFFFILQKRHRADGTVNNIEVSGK